MQVFTGTFNNESQLQCTSCYLNLDSEQHYKDHYKSDFHRYNIKRKMLGLKPATQEQFFDKKNDNAVEEAKPASALVCNSCRYSAKLLRKSFTNHGAYKQHLQSRKHIEIDKKDKERKVLVDKKKEKREIGIETCLFCDTKSRTMEDNLSHMSVQHGFFVPQVEYCKDDKGLIKYLHEKVEVGLLCIFCDNKGFRDFLTPAAVRSHMTDKRHTFLNISAGFEEFEEFYDFSVLFEERVETQKGYKYIPGLQEHTVEVDESGTSRQRERRTARVPVRTIGAQEAQPSEHQIEEELANVDEQESEGEEWSDVEGEEGEEKPITNIRKYVFYKPSILQSGELLLPNGKLLGNRKYNHLYRQYFRPFMSARSRLGLTNGRSTELLLKSEGIRLFKEQDKRFLTQKLFEKNRDLKLRLSQNKLQYHFRCQNPK